jgi:argonaute-like protein implicated in RNA metabolism and viral defense
MLEVNREWVKIRFTDDSSEERVPTSAVIPKCSLRMLDAVLRHQRIPFDLHQAIKIHSLSSKPSAARERSDRIDTVVEYLVSNVSPITLGDLEITLERRPVQLAEYGTSTADSLPVFRLAEPAVVFREQRASTDVRDGITKFGSYEDKPHHIELIPVCVQSQRHNMAQLIERLQVGKYKYRGAERTFSTSFNYQTIVTVDSPETIQKEVKRLIRENRGWVGDKALGRLFLVHTPEQGYASDDEKSPYYQVKRLLLENGIPCQMVDTPTLVDPDWKDLNLALNITAKCGLTPWVLPDAIPDADFFVGLSYTQARNSQRIIGFANVFNRYGNWEFYSGNTTSFDFQRRAETFSNLVRDTLTRLPLSLTPNIVFHYSAKFSHEDRDAILQAARSVRREGTFTFVWINSHHNVRVFDSRPETDGSLRRGSYVRTRRNQIYLSTTGSNPFRKVLGTPMPLEVNAWVYQPENQPQVPPDMKSIAVQVLSLTKLNWASTDSFCGEPITTKYAGDIAYLTAAFLRQSEPFRLHEVLERTAWFL